MPTAELTPVDHDEWLDTRTTGIGGSDVASIAGLNPWAGPFEVFASKNRGYRSEENAATRWGHILEPVVAREWAKENGRSILAVPCTFRADDRPWAMANVDRFVLTDRESGFEDDALPRESLDLELLLDILPFYELLEIKTAGQYMADQWGTPDEPRVPIYYQTQGQHYLDVLGLPRVTYVVLIGGRDLRAVTMEADPEAQARIRELVDSFWHDHVVADVEPVARDRSTLDALYPVAEPERVTLPAAAAALVERRHELTAAMKRAEVERDQLDARFAQWLGTADEGVLHPDDEKPAVTWRQGSKGRVNKPAMETDPEWEAIADTVAEIENKYRAEPARSLRFARRK